MTDRFAPDPQFVASLEWQLASESRRRSRFPEPATSGRGRRFNLALAAALLVSGLVVGAGGVVAAEKAQVGARRAALLARTDILIETAERRREFAAEALAETERAVAAGFVSEGGAAVARGRFAEAETEVARLKLDHEEIVAAAAPPRSDLGAPLVGGRDFVAERLKLDLAAAEGRRERATAAAALAARLVSAGVAPSETGLAAASEEKSAIASVEEAALRLDLRARFLAGEMNADDADRSGLLAEARGRLAAAAERSALAEARLGRARVLSENGFVGAGELREIEAEAVRADAERRLFALDVEVLERRARRGR